MTGILVYRGTQDLWNILNEYFSGIVLPIRVGFFVGYPRSRGLKSSRCPKYNKSQIPGIKSRDLKTKSRR